MVPQIQVLVLGTRSSLLNKCGGAEAEEIEK